MSAHEATVPTFTAGQRPPEIVAVAGEWIAAQLGGSARYLRSKCDVIRKRDGRAVGLTLQTSRRSATGVGTWVWPRVWEADDRVRAWKSARPDAIVFGRSGVIYATLVVNLGLGEGMIMAAWPIVLAHR